MFYLITITRNGKTFYVISPKWGVYELAEARERNTYLWQTQEDCEKDHRWKHLIQPGDKVEYKRTYQC